MCVCVQYNKCLIVLAALVKPTKLLRLQRKRDKKETRRKKKRATSHVEIVSDRVRNESAGRGRESGATIVPKGKLMTV